MRYIQFSCDYGNTSRLLLQVLYLQKVSVFDHFQTQLQFCIIQRGHLRTVMF